MEKCRDYWEENHKQDRNIVVDENNILTDGYIQYLVLKENNIDIADIQRIKCKEFNNRKCLSYRNTDTLYIYGTHVKSRSEQERIWRVPDSQKNWWLSNVSVGDIVSVETKYGKKAIIVTDIRQLNRCPVDMIVKKVIDKIADGAYRKEAIPM